MNDRRDEFLLAMYGQMWSNIERHILVIWQSIAALVGAFAVFALIEKNIMPLDLACTLLVIVCAWVLAHVIDANHWFARNLLIIVNIERQFLRASDLKDIHPYFGVRRSPTTLDHLEVQTYLAYAVYALIIVWHFAKRVAPGWGAPWNGFEISRVLPYLASLIATCLLIGFRRKLRKAYESLAAQAPGITVV